jgi:PKHD-type hydroxylase
MELVPYFHQKHRPDMSGWYYFEDGFSVEEIDSILEMSNQFPFVAGKISADDGSIDGSEYRISNIKWISATDSANNAIHRTHWIYDRLMEMIETANNAMWGFHLHGLTDSIQYTEYNGSEEGFYDWHVDIGPDELALRKLSLVVQLSDPSEYEGGYLQIKTGKYEASPIKKKGTVVVFPSYLLHRVTPVTSGIRKSLVLWAGGSALK